MNWGSYAVRLSKRQDLFRWDRTLFAALILIYALICCGVITWGFADTRRVLSCPFQFAATSLLLVVPQLTIVFLSKTHFPEEVCVTFTFYCILCFVAVLLGNMSYTPPPLQRVVEIDEKKMVRVATFVSIAGLAGWVGFHSYFILYGPPKGLWTGWIVYWSTLLKLIIPSFMFWRVLYVFYRKRPYSIASIVVSIPMLMQAFLNGRRTWAFMLLYAWLLPYILTGRFKVHRWQCFVFFFLAFATVTLFPAYRVQLMAGGFDGLYTAIMQRSPLEVLSTYFSGMQTLEVVDAIKGFIVIESTGYYSYGLRMFDGIIHSYLPGSLVGQGVKDLWRSGTQSYVELTRNAIYSVDTPFGVETTFYCSKTGFLDSFAEFSWFGVLLYFFLGRFFKDLYVNGVERKEKKSMLIIIFLGFIPASLVYGEWSFIIPVYLPSFFISWYVTNYCFRTVQPNTDYGISGIPDAVST